MNRRMVFNTAHEWGEHDVDIELARVSAAQQTALVGHVVTAGDMLLLRNMSSADGVHLRDIPKLQQALAQFENVHVSPGDAYAAWLAVSDDLCASWLIVTADERTCGKLMEYLTDAE